jgi:DNA-binding NarL/FixJ family response regulator
MRARRTAPQPSSETIRVVMVEPRSLLGVAVREVLQQEAGIEVVAQVRSADEALEIVDEAAPDVILLGGALGEGSSAAGAARRLHDETPTTGFVVLGGEDDDASIVGAVQMGATGHVSEVAQPEELVDTIRRVADGEDPLRAELAGRPDLVGRIVDEVRHSLELDAAPENPMTPRETEVLGLVASGLRNREIATTLDLSEQTVKNHLTGILHRLGAPNRTRAVMYAVRQGWLELPAVVGPRAADRAPTLIVVSNREAADAGSSE